MDNEKKKSKGLIEILRKVYDKDDLMYIILVSFTITVIFGDEFKNIAGENYELVRFIILMVLAFYTISYIKLCIVSKEAKELREVIDNSKELDNHYAQALKLYKDNLEASEQLRNAYVEASNSLKLRIEKLEKEVKEKEGIE